MRPVFGKTSFDKAFNEVEAQTKSVKTTPNAGQLKTAIETELVKSQIVSSVDAPSEVDVQEVNARAQELAGRLLDTLLRCTNEQHLSLATLDSHELDAIIDAPPAVWAHYANWSAEGGRPIANVTIDLPQKVLGALARLDNLCKGLGSIQGLSQLDLRLPKDAPQNIQLGKLEKTSLTITITGTLPGMHLTVPAGCNVMATGSQNVALDKAWVHYVDSGKEIDKKVLANFPYFRAAKEFQGGGSTIPFNAHGRYKTHQEQVAAFDKNGEINFPSLGDYKEHLILCRHLTAGWLDARILYHEAKRRGSKERFSMVPFTDRVSVQKMALTAERDFRNAACRGAFSPERYGQMLTKLFAEMKSKSESVRHFLISTTEHVVGVELQIDSLSTDESQYTVSLFYDPKHTATYAPYVAVGKRGLENLSKQPFGLWADRDEEFPVYTIHDWPPRREGAKQEPNVASEMVLLDDVHGRTSRGFVMAAMKSGDPELVKRALESPRGSAEAFAFGFQYAMERGSTTAVGIYLKTLLGEGSVDESGLCRMLMGKTEIPLMAVLQGEHADTAREYARSVANSASLNGPFKVELLLGRDRSKLCSLYRVCGGEPVAGYNASADFVGRRAAINAFASEIVKAEGLTAREKGEVLGCRAQNGRSAVQTAIEKNNPSAAAAIFCAILEDTTPRAQIPEVLKWAAGAVVGTSMSGISVEDVLTALAEKKGDQESAVWLARILKALPGSNLDDNGALQKKFEAHLFT